MRLSCFAVLAGLVLGCGNDKGSLPEPLSNKQADDPCDPGGGPNNNGSAPPVDAGSVPVALPGGAAGIGFDDLRFSSTLAQLLVPAGRTGSLDLIDPSSEQVAPVTGFSSQASYAGTDTFGVTSADEGEGTIYATDRTSKTVAIVDGMAHTLVSSTMLASTPGYVRFVQPTEEVWVTEPDAKAVEVLSTVADAGAPRLVHAASIAVSGAESLAVDAANHMAFTNAASSTVAIDVDTRAVKATWANGCTTAKGIAVDSTNKWVIVACNEGRVVVLDETKGSMLGTVTTGGGVDQIAYDARRIRLYVPAPAKAEVSVVTVDPSGAPSILGSVQATSDAHCVVTPGGGQVFVCVPSKGQLVFLFDPFQ